MYWNVYFNIYFAYNWFWNKPVVLYFDRCDMCKHKMVYESSDLYNIQKPAIKNSDFFVSTQFIPKKLK